MFYDISCKDRTILGANFRVRLWNISFFRQEAVWLASRLMHYIIASEVMKEVPMNRNLFILGNLAPDAHDGTLKGNSCSHFRRIVEGDYDIYPNLDLERFKEKYLKNTTDEFIVGYYCHLISDDHWVKSIYPDYLKFDLDNEAAKKQRELLFRDLRVFNTILRRFYEHHFQDDIGIPGQIGVEEILCDRLKVLVDELHNDFIVKAEDIELKIFTIDFILEYINASVDRCIKELRTILFL